MSAPPIEAPAEHTRDAIRRVAKPLFAEHGYSATSVRDIANATGVNAALVIRYFGSKEALFLETMSMDERFAGITDPPMPELGRSIVDRLVNHDGASRRFYTVLMRAADRPEIRAHVARAITEQIVEPLATQLGGDDARDRARLIAAQITGLLNELWIVEEPEITNMPKDRIVDLYGASIQALVDGRYSP